MKEVVSYMSDNNLYWVLTSTIACLSTIIGVFIGHILTLRTHKKSILIDAKKRFNERILDALSDYYPKLTGEYGLFWTRENEIIGICNTFSSYVENKQTYDEAVKNYCDFAKEYDIILKNAIMGLHTQEVVDKKHAEFKAKVDKLLSFAEM